MTMLAQEIITSAEVGRMLSDRDVSRFKPAEIREAIQTLVTEGKEFPDNSLIVGSPAKVLRVLTEEAILGMHANTQNYVRRAQEYKTQLKRIDTE